MDMFVESYVESGSDNSEKQEAPIIWRPTLAKYFKIVLGFAQHPEDI